MFVRPVTLVDALDRLSQGARVLAGCTDILPAMGETGLVGDFVDVSRLPEIRGISRYGHEIRFGGATTWTTFDRLRVPA